MSQIESRLETPNELDIPDEPKMDNETSVNAEPEMFDEPGDCALQEMLKGLDVPVKPEMRNDEEDHDEIPELHTNSLYEANGTCEPGTKYVNINDSTDDTHFEENDVYESNDGMNGELDSDGVQF